MTSDEARKARFAAWHEYRDASIAALDKWNAVTKEIAASCEHNWEPQYSHEGTQWYCDGCGKTVYRDPAL